MTQRRDFLKQTGLGLAGATGWMHTGRAAGANERLTIGVIGCGGMGSNHIRFFLTEQDVQIAWVCDPDEARLAAARQAVEAKYGKAPRGTKDIRHVLDDKGVDAVVVATPDHWHGPAALLACAAGKHVYVEKPCAHNLREGRLMIEAARKHRRIIQTGTQARSTAHVRRAIELIQGGAIGDILVAKAWDSQMRKNIGHAKPSTPPEKFDYDLWVGPAPLVPFQSNRHHYTWHWWYDFGTGDMGNDGVHELDIARWGLGVQEHPATITALGGKLMFDDDQQFPDTQYVAFEFPGDGKVGHKKMLIYEQRIWSPYTQEGYENGNAFYGTRGMLVLGKGVGWQLLGPKNELIEQGAGKPDVLANHRNFIESIRGTQQPNAGIEIAHRSAALCHLGNIATRTGRVLHFDPKTEQIVNDPEANALVRRIYREGHWAVPSGV